MMRPCSRDSFAVPLHVLVLVLVVVLAAACATAAVPEERTIPEDATWFSVEIEGTLCGYGVVTSENVVVDGRPTRVIEEDIEVHLTALGMPVDTEIETLYHVDPETDRYRHYRLHVVQGATDIEWTVDVEGDTARVFSSMTGQETEVDLPPDVILGHPLGAAHLVRDFARGDLDEATYPTLEPREAAIQNVRFTRVGTETLDLPGGAVETIVLDQVNEANGVRARLWVDPATGESLKLDLPNGRRVIRADATVTKRLKVANLDPGLFVPAGVQIADVPRIASMTVRATFEPTGLVLTVDDLNVRGQRFEGTVEEGRIEGVFRIEHQRYDGTDAPPFPTPFGDDPDLAAYLEPSDLIEAEDPELVAHARALTEGATDAWDAATRISGWVARNIDYAIPGGATARRTFDTRAGECGAHSNLVAALARAVDIPARVVWGCMYVPNGGGQFGQHGWNELYMGEAGWIPVDATAYEVDFVDSGHIRIGEHRSLSSALNPIEARVVDYALTGADESESEGPAASERFAAYIGTYDIPQLPGDVTVDVRDGSLVVDIPNKIALAMNEPGDDGRWVCTMTDRLYVMFERSEDDAVVAMVLHELVRMQRTGDPEEIAEDVSDALRPLLGTYTMAQLGAEFEVLIDDGRLAIRDPLAKRIIHLGEPSDDGSRMDEFGQNRITFERDAEGAVAAFVIDAASRFARK